MCQTYKTKAMIRKLNKKSKRKSCVKMQLLNDNIEDPSFRAKYSTIYLFITSPILIYLSYHILHNRIYKVKRFFFLIQTGQHPAILYLHN